MKKIIISSLVSLCFICLSFGQEKSFHASISNDTILIGNYFEIRFDVKNASGKFEQPDFEGFRIIGGPNTSSSIQMINGEISQQSSYSFYLEPEEVGLYYITEAYFHSDDQVLETKPIRIVVLDNPEGIIQKHNNWIQKDEFIVPPGSENIQKPVKKKAKRHKI